MQSILGSPNYYSRFIEDFSVYASVLYELREDDFHEIRRTYDDPRTVEVAGRNRLCHIAHKGDRDRYPISGSDRDRFPISGGDQDPEGRSRWEKATIAFTFLKQKIATTPILKHFDPDRPLVIVVYASKWAVSAALLQKHEGVYWPVTFSIRTLKLNEVKNGMVEKEVLAFLRILGI